MEEPRISWIVLNNDIEAEAAFESWDGPCYTDCSSDNCDSHSDW